MSTIYVAKRTPRAQPYVIADTFAKAAISLEDQTPDQLPPTGSVIEVMEPNEQRGGVFEVSQRLYYRHGVWETAGGDELGVINLPTVSEVR